MRKLTFVCFLVFFFVNTCVVFAEGTKRTAVIEDSAGVITEVRDLSFSENFLEFGFAYIRHPLHSLAGTGRGTGIVVNFDKIFDVAIFVDSLESIAVKNGVASVVYKQGDQVKTVTTKLRKVTIYGQSKFGDFELSTDNLRKLTFKEPPVIESEKKIPFTTTLVLTNGSRVPVAGLYRCDFYFDTAGYISGGRNACDQISDIRFLRGKSLTTIDFEKINKIAFQSVKNVVVTLKDGDTISGILTNEKRAEVECFTGIYKEGYFFISSNNVKNIKEIEFGN